MQRKLKFIKTKTVKTPEYGTAGSAGIDFFIPVEVGPYLLRPGDDVLIPSGIRAKVPDGHALITHNKSGVATKLRLHVGAAVVDSDYQGEIHMHVHNIGHNDVMIEPGMKLVQFLLIPVTTAKLIECKTEDEVFPVKTKRGRGGFGSTNTNKDSHS